MSFRPSLIFAAVVAMGALVPSDKLAAQVSVAQSPSAILQHKLDFIVIDKISFKDADLPVVVSFLSKKSKELDPDKQGVNFVISGDLMAPDHPARPVSLSMENASLSDILAVISAQTGLAYNIEDYAVFFRAASDQSEPLTIRTFLVPAGFFTTVDGPPADLRPDDVKKLLISHGIHFPDGATAVYVSASGKMVVRDTPTQLDAVAKLFDTSAK